MKRWQPFMVYLDPHDPEDREVINFLKANKRRRNISHEIREALVLYMSFLRRRKTFESSGVAAPEPSRPAPMRRDISISEPEPQTIVNDAAREAARTFLKRRS